MDFLREIVSGPKVRYQSDGYNLDLSYVTPRIIAMAYPAQGFEKLYRNSIDTVKHFLEKHHSNHYQIINVSGRDINSDKLLNISSFYWQDHKTPEFQTLFVICQTMMNHLIKDVKNVCVVHCNHGKGRTGTLICCFMLFAGYFSRVEDAMKFYQKQRFQKQGYGVTQPCQIKYIQYFNEILHKPKLFPMVLSLHKITLTGKHNLYDPYFKLRSVEHNDYLLSTKDERMEILEVEKKNQTVVKMRKDAFFFGDVVLEIKHNPVVGKKVAANYAFNTAFFENSYKDVEIKLSQLSPLSSVKSGVFEKQFSISLTFKKMCNCSSSLEENKRCQKCRSMLSIEQKKWQTIYDVIKNKTDVDGQWILFGYSDSTNKFLLSDSSKGNKRTA